MKKLLVLEVAALGADLLAQANVQTLAGLPVQRMAPVFPAVTCTAQATLRTALAPAAHGMWANGRYFRETMSTAFWNQSAGLVHGERVWSQARQQGARVGLYFFQQSLGEAADEIVSPAPIHTHGGGLIMATYQKPSGVLGIENPVPLWRYWGPLASPKAGWGIVQALMQRLARGDAPELLFAYLPTLDYDLQRFGPDHPRAAASLRLAIAQIEALAAAARRQGYAVVIAGDYAIEAVQPGADFEAVAFPNRALRASGLFATRAVRAMAYPDFYRSRAVAVCDHQVALLYVLDASAASAACDTLSALPQVERLLPGPGGEGPDWIAVARPGCWFAWPWWREQAEAPDYAAHVDIHNKPGFDPCELFFGRVPWRISQDVRRVRGTHGRAQGPGTAVAYASEVALGAPQEACAFAQALQQCMC